MITKNINACLFCRSLIIGRQMENNYRQFIFDCTGFPVEVTSIMLVHQRSRDVAPYIAATSNTNTLTWTVTDTDTAYAGYGSAELRITFADGLAKSIVYQTNVIASITGDTVIPEPLQSWYDALIEYIDEHAASPEQIAEAVADYIETHPIDAPVQSVNGKTGTVVLTAADVGALADSVTIPTRVSQLTNDAGYITSAPVQSVNNKTGVVVLSASDVEALPDTTTAADIGGYVKPSAGIPKTDLSATVQASLDKADTALQTAPVTSVDGKTGAVQILPNGGSAGQVLTKTASGTAWQTVQGGGAVDSVNGQIGTVVLTASDVGALPDSTVIPTVPTNVSAFQNDAGYLTAVPSEYVTDTELTTALAPKANTANLATVATSGDYADLTGKPTIPTVPSNVSAFTNDAGYITASQAPVQSVNGQTGAVTVSVPTKTSDLTNDSGFITSAPVSSVDGKTGAVTVIPTGGSAGQVLAKASATDRDVEWITPSGGGGSDWQVLHDSTTTEDAILQIAVTNISVSEFMVYIIAKPSTNVQVYISPNNPNGNHYDGGYGRFSIGTSTTTGNPKYAWAHIHHQVGTLLPVDKSSDDLQYGGTSNPPRSMAVESTRTMAFTDKYTSISVATYQTVTSGTRVIVLGK